MALVANHTNRVLVRDAYFYLYRRNFTDEQVMKEMNISASLLSELKHIMTHGF